MSSSVNNSRRIVVPFTNRKLATKALLNRSKLRKIPSTSPNYNIFINENLALKNSKIAFLCRKLKRADKLRKHLQEMVQYISPSQIFKEEKH